MPNFLAGSRRIAGFGEDNCTGMGMEFSDSGAVSFSRIGLPTPYLSEKSPLGSKFAISATYLAVSTRPTYSWALS